EELRCTYCITPHPMTSRPPGAGPRPGMLPIASQVGKKQRVFLGVVASLRGCLGGGGVDEEVFFQLR
uniref:Uncharacterized protein n=1 Tax=Aquila chrysaetos chrysaetos TaxID=223781 RepID=A0A663ECZ3_AQUCH